MKNRYSKSSKISEVKIREVVRYFAADLTAIQASPLSGLNRNPINRIYRALRARIQVACEAWSPFFGVIEVDEGGFGAKRVKGKRGWGASGKTTGFGIFEREGLVYTELVPDGSKARLHGIIRGKVAVESVINSDGLAANSASVLSPLSAARAGHLGLEGRRAVSSRFLHFCTPRLAPLGGAD